MDISVLGLPQSGKSTFLKSLIKFKESQELPEICTLKIKWMDIPLVNGNVVGNKTNPFKFI